MTPVIIHINNPNVRPDEVTVDRTITDVVVHISEERIPGLRPTFLVFRPKSLLGAHFDRVGDVLVATGECGCP